MTPDRYRVARDAALERGDEAAVLEAERGAELWHRPPEEWELERGVPFVRGTLLTISGHVFRPGDWVSINGQRVDDARDARSLAVAINAAPGLRTSRVEGSTIWVEAAPCVIPEITIASWDTDMWASGPKDRRHTNSNVPLFVRNASRRMDGRRR